MKNVVYNYKFEKTMLHQNICHDGLTKQLSHLAVVVVKTDSPPSSHTISPL